MTRPESPPAPEQTFFDHPAHDRMLAMLMALAAEVWVLNDRLRAMESLLAEQGTLARESLDRYVPDDQAERAIAAEREAFVKSLMDPLFGHDATRGIPDSLRPGRTS